MNFNQLWTLMQEAITLQAPIDVQFHTVSTNQYYEGTWKIDDIKYRAIAATVERNLPGTNVPMNAFEVFFQSSTSPKSFSMDITGTAKAKAISAYNGLLIFIKQLIEKQIELQNPIEALVFLGSQDKMDILYDKFFKMFLGDKFKRLDAETIISNEAIQKVNKIKPTYKIQKHLQNAEEEHQERLDSYRQKAREERKNQRIQQNFANFFNVLRNRQ